MATSKEFFTTEQVVELLGLKAKDKWRIIKFVEGKEYGIEPAMVMGKGLGSRRLYNLENVCKIAVAIALLEAGLRPAVIGDALARLPRMADYLKEGDHNLYIIMARERQFGRLLSKSRLMTIDISTVAYSPDAPGEEFRSMNTGEFAVLYVPIAFLFSRIKQRLEQMRASE